MNAQSIIKQIKKRRRSSTVNTDSQLKNQIALIRRELVKMAFQKNTNTVHHQELLAELDAMKLRLKQVAQFKQ